MKSLSFRVETLRNYGYDDQEAAQGGDDQTAIKKSLLDQAGSWVRQFDANSLIVLRKAGVQFDVRQELSAIKVPVLYVLSRTDKLFPPCGRRSYAIS